MRATKNVMRVGLALGVGCVVALLPAASAAASMDVQVGDACVIVGADNVPTDGSYHRVDECRMTHPGPL